jgi:multidrug efflux pump
MNISEPFIERPVATTLLTLGLFLAGFVAFFLLPVAPLPQVDIPTIGVFANMAGASPENMANSVATPLERRLSAISDVTEMTSSSSVGRTQIVLQFGLNRDIDGAARDVQAAINAARADLPTSLRSNPTYRKFNPADQPVLMLTMQSDTLSMGQVYDAASIVLQQKLSQLPGVGQVNLFGSSNPAVRVELNPKALWKYGIGLADVRAALSSANANAPKGQIEVNDLRYQIYTNDQARTADEYRPLVIAYRNGAAIRLGDVADVVDSVEDIRNQGLTNGKPAIIVAVQKAPGANIIELADSVLALMPELRASIPNSIDLKVGIDRTITIRRSLIEVERTLLISTALVIGVVFIFLRDARATMVPAVAVPVSLVATFGAMYLLGFSLNNLSLMALTVATGFVVDDAIVVLENTKRHIEAGMPRYRAALQGAREVGFTVLSMSISLVAVFGPILLMGGLPGRFFREFSLVLTVSILISMVVSLTTTPMMCARLLRDHSHPAPKRRSRLLDMFEAGFARMTRGYDRALVWSLRNGRLVLLILLIAIVLNVYLYIMVPKGFFPQQDTGQLFAGIRGDQSISFQAMQQKIKAFQDILLADPAVDRVVGFTGGGPGGGGTNPGRMFISLKPRNERDPTEEVMSRLRPKLSGVPGAQAFIGMVGDIPGGGGRQSDATYQYTLLSDDIGEVRKWAKALTLELQNNAAELTDVNSDQQDGGLEVALQIDRDTAARLGIQTSQIDNALYDAFGQRTVSTIFNAINQYKVVMEVDPRFWQSPETLNEVFIPSSGAAPRGSQATNALAGTFSATVGSGPKTTTQGAANSTDSLSVRNAAQNRISSTAGGGSNTGSSVSTTAARVVPLSALATWGPGTTPLSVNHQGPFVATTISFNLATGVSLGQATDAIKAAEARIKMPTSIVGEFAGSARQFQQSSGGQPILVLATLLAVYIVLGILYESYVHPLTVLSTLPSAGLGALLGLLLFNTEFSIIAFIGVILLIGIVKKNAIMMIDFALDAERTRGLDSKEAIREACLLRFRPIMMTTAAAMLGALPLALGSGDGAELRQPLGISIFGGLLVSQVLTLFTTPVIYLALDKRRKKDRPIDAALVPAE